MAEPLFFFGFQRSGTTLLSMMLDCHPDLAVPFSLTGMWYRYAEKIRSYNDLRSITDLARLVDDLLAEERIRLWKVPIDPKAVLDGMPPGNYPRVIERFHMLYAHHHGKSRWGHLDIMTTAQMHVAMSWFPEAKFVHLVRDGRDVALSNQTIPYSVGNIAECAVAWHREVGTNLRLGEAIGPERYLVVHYEELIRRPTATLQTICEFIGLPFSSAMLDYPEKVGRRVPAHRRFLWPRLDGPLDPSRVFRWKAEMGVAQRTVVERIAAPTLQALGYEVESASRLRWRVRLLAAWYALGRGHRWSRLARRFGVAKMRSGPL